MTGFSVTGSRPSPQPKDPLLPVLLGTAGTAVAVAGFLIQRPWNGLAT